MDTLDVDIGAFNIYNSAGDSDTLDGRLAPAREACGMTTAQRLCNHGNAIAPNRAPTFWRRLPAFRTASGHRNRLNISLPWLIHDGVGDAPNDNLNSDIVSLLRGHLEQMKGLCEKTDAIIECLETELQRL